ncbi:MAG: helix-turn-helix transcriptional regulator [Lachnospiraceae bacterium]|nr:helix-turn-helix transcriptional regulator [Lachnospiraceae bacterium]
MILADKIINERKKNGWSQEELADMLSVSRQSVSKWEGAQSVPDLSKILKMAELFGVSTDYLLKDEIEISDATARVETVDSVPPMRKVSMDEASEFISLRKQVLPKIGIGVMLCITCPVILLIMSGLASAGKFGISEGVAAAVGLVFLFLQVGTGIFLFITHGRKLGRYDFLEKECFETEYGVDGMAKERLAANEASNTRALVTGVLFCVLGALPIIVCSVLGLPEIIIVSMVALLLVLVAIAVYLFMSVVAVNASYKMLLQIDDYAPGAKKKNVKLEPLARVYWLLVVVIFLAVSFLTNRWDRTWIIWAVSGVLFALIRVIAESFIKTE